MAVGAAALCAAIVILASCGGRKKTAFDTVTISRGSITKSVTATGTIEPINQVEVGTQVSGIVDKLYADYNSEVKKGQLLAEMDRTNLIADLNSVTAMLNQAEVEYNYQLKNYERSKRLHEKGLISDTDYESAEYQYSTSKLQLERQRSEISKARRNLEYATITSPIDGVVLSREVDEGQTVAAGLNTPTLFKLAADLTQMQVVASVDEADIGVVSEGQRVTFTVDAFPDDVFEGSVSQVRLNPQTESNVTTYQIIVNAPNEDLKLKPGLTANITIYTTELDNVFTVPMKALRFAPNESPDANDGNTLWLMKDGTPTPVKVTIGINDGINTVVEGDAIREGDIVITEYLSLEDLLARKKEGAEGSLVIGR
jgi:HlyD family secretion protein